MEHACLESALQTAAGKNRLINTYKRIVYDNLRLVRERGFRVLLWHKGWKLFVLFCLYYFIRDSILYIAIPFMLARFVVK